MIFWAALIGSPHPLHSPTRSIRLYDNYQPPGIIAAFLTFYVLN